MNKTEIDWPGLDYTWNPQVGCERCCPYCVVRKRVWPRIRHLYGNNDYDKVTFLPEQLDKPKEIKKPSKFFVDFYSDIEYSTRENLQKTIDVCLECERHTFMFLTKNYTVYNGYSWPKNTMQGVTMECDRHILPQKQVVDTFLRSKYRRHFFSLEPLLGTLKTEIDNSVELVIVGAMTGAGAIIPKKEWIQSVRDNVPADKIYFKKNIRRYL